MRNRTYTKQQVEEIVQALKICSNCDGRMAYPASPCGDCRFSDKWSNKRIENIIGDTNAK